MIRKLAVLLIALALTNPAMAGETIKEKLQSEFCPVTGRDIGKCPLTPDALKTINAAMEEREILLMDISALKNLQGDKDYKK